MKIKDEQRPDSEMDGQTQEPHVFNPALPFFPGVPDAFPQRQDRQDAERRPKRQLKTGWWKAEAEVG